MVWVVDKVGPQEDVAESGCVSRVPVCDTLHVFGHLGGAVEGLALLDLVDHLPHVHLDLAAVLADSVETACRRLVTTCSLSILHVSRILNALVYNMRLNVLQDLA
jgi:hypothetical protein